MIIYSFTNKINGKKYIGQTCKTLEYRVAQHINYANNGHGFKLHEAIRKYGIDNFDIKVECSCSSIDELNLKEIFYINKYDSINNGYNLAPGGGDNPMRSEQVANKHLAKMRSPEVRKKISESIKKSIAKKGGVSQEARNKISQKLKGNQHGKGKVRSIEATLKASRAKFKPVYCTDYSGELVGQFESVQAGAKFLVQFYNTDNWQKMMNIIKYSNVNNKFVKGFLWHYGVPCVETIETINNDNGVE